MNSDSSFGAGRKAWWVARSIAERCLEWTTSLGDRGGRRPASARAATSAISILLALASAQCTVDRTGGVPPDAMPRVTIAFDISAADGILAAARGVVTESVGGWRDSLPILATGAGVGEADFVRALRGEPSSSGLRLDSLRNEASYAIATRRLRVAISAMAIRRGAIESAVSRYLPLSVPRTTLRVRACFGMPEGFLAAPVEDLAGRGLVLDLGALAERCGVRDSDPAFEDRFGEELTRILAPEAFITGYDALERTLRSPVARSDLERFRRALLVFGVADHLARRPQERFDDQGRRRPEVDLAARVAIARFERNLARYFAPETPSDEREALRFSFASNDSTQDSNWGVIAGSVMIDAIDRFAPHDRIRKIVAEGPTSLARAYAEVCSGHAAIPRMGTEAIARLSR